MGMDLSWTERLALWAYGVMMRALQPLLRRKLRRRGQQEPGYLINMPERFGFYDGLATEPGRIWVHAVSLGETRAAAILIEALRAVWPDMRLLLTHSTASGWAQGQCLLRSGDAQAWLPWDTPEATRGFLLHHRPRLGILMETEVWPVLVQACVQARVPLALANARLNAKSLRSGLRWSMLSRPAYRCLSAVWAQSPQDRARLEHLGATVQAVLGNLKFDVQPQPDAQALAQVWRKQWHCNGSPCPVVMLASSREGEEALWLQALMANADRLAAFRAGGVVWLLVPRHPQRCSSLELERGTAVACSCRQGASLAGRQLGRDAGVFSKRRYGLAGRQFHVIGWTEPDRGCCLWLPGHHGPAHLQLHRSRPKRRASGGCGPCQ